MTDSTDTANEAAPEADAPEDPRPLLRFGGVELVRVEREAEGRVHVLCFSRDGAREPGRFQLRPDLHWFRCDLSREEPLIELLLDGGFYHHTEFGPRGMDLGDAELAGRLSEHDPRAFPEVVELEAVKVKGWKA